MAAASPVDDEIALDALSAFTIRLLSADMVDKANSGHLGAPFGCAPLSNALWGKIMRFSPTKRWINRDRFVLSAGHASALLYSMLHLTGNGLGGPYEVTMDALKQFRKAGSSTPGHPEFRMTSGVEVTTGPLGQGFANAVGMAIAEAHLAARFNRKDFPLFDNYTFVLAGDGCLMEGISTEAASLAGHLKLHKLIVFYDDNKVTIDGTTDISFSEDIPAKFAAMRWNVLHIPNGDEVDATVYEKVVQEAKSQTEKPTIVVMKTTIGCGAGVGIEGAAKAHGGKFSTLEAIRQKWFSPAGLSKLGGAVEQRVAALVQSELDHLSSDPCANGSKPTVLPKFYVPRPVMKRFRDAGAKGDVMAEEWEKMVEKYCQTFASSDPDLVKDLKARMDGHYVSDEWDRALADLLSKEKADIEANLRELSNTVELPDNGMGLEPKMKRRKTFDSGFKYKAGRVYASQVLKCFAQHNPAVIGGSPDVASSCGAHFPDIQGHFLPPSYAEKYKGASYGGRYIHFGVREHAALAILNGISSSSFLIPYSSFFTIFYQYGLPAVRMASISKFPVLYIGTHDSIDLGEDGPTHQPVEVLPQLRAMPNLLVIRPANVAETVGAFQIFAEQYQNCKTEQQYIDPKPLKRRPVFIMTSRGELGVPYKPSANVEGQDGVKRGAYVIHECYDRKNGADDKTSLACLPDIVLIGSGQDVALVMKTKELLLQWSADFNARLKGAFDGYPKAMPVIAEPIKVRIVSMPCWELFDEQDQDYQDSVLLSNYRDILRIYVEKAATKNTGHDKYAHFSEKLEFTPEYIAAKVSARK
ncbi:unnamed protein product, partial [Prorocentrum cordatum]